MPVRPMCLAVLCLSVLLPASAAAQYGVRGSVPDPATGESYHLEVSGLLWSPTPTLLISSESLGIAGDQIDFVNDFGFENTRFRQLRVALRPARKHKLRFEYTPISYSSEGLLSRSVVFNGQRFDISLPVQADVRWRAMRFGYEWDFIYRDRGYLGLLIDAKYTDVQASLENRIVGREFVSARAPIPTVGVVGRGYVLPNVSITGEFSLFRLPEGIDENYQGRYYDFDLYGTVNFTDNFGAQGGYRSLTVFYRVDDDTGDLKLRGMYFGGVIRF